MTRKKSYFFVFHFLESEATFRVREKFTKKNSPAELRLTRRFVKHVSKACQQKVKQKFARSFD
jgi:hypothetical protein